MDTNEWLIKKTLINNGDVNVEKNDKNRQDGKENKQSGFKETCEQRNMIETIQRKGNKSLPFYYRACLKELLIRRERKGRVRW